MTAQPRLHTPVPGRLFFLSDALKVRRKRTPIIMTHKTEVGVGLGVFLGLGVWASIALIAWSLLG